MLEPRPTSFRIFEDGPAQVGPNSGVRSSKGVSMPDISSTTQLAHTARREETRN